MPSDEAPLRRLRRVAALGVSSLLAAAAAAVALVLLLPAHAAALAVVMLMLVLVAALLLALCLAWPDLRRAALLREAVDRTAIRYAAFAWDRNPLTELPNRFCFQQVLAQLAAQPDGGTLILVNLAGPQAVNDPLGQGLGDSMLREVARRLRNQIRPDDDVFRLGGDEFAVIATGLRTPEAAGAMAGRIQRALAAPFGPGGGAPLRAVIGHAHMPGDAQEADSLCRAAALALAQAKRQGNGAVVAYDPALGERVARRLLLREKLMAAVAAGEFELAWQAQVDGR
ncbi:MAG TPA: GGDEF domain-containing protein, partial [Roseomonas sp.]